MFFFLTISFKLVQKRRSPLKYTAQHNQATRTSDKEPRRTPNKNTTGHKAEHGQANHQNDKQSVTDKESKCHALGLLRPFSSYENDTLIYLFDILQSSKSNSTNKKSFRYNFSD
jgi:hypothetical protein